MDNNEITNPVASADRLLAGSQKLTKLRHRFKKGLLLAIDNDVVMSYVSPKQKNSSIVADLLRDQDGFTQEDQAISLSERVGRYILYEAANRGDGCVFSLPGHHAELWSNQASGIHAKLTAELVAPGSNQSVSSQILRFRDEFYQVALTNKRKITLSELLNVVPEQFMGWLGLGVAAQEWQRLQELAVKKVLQPFPREITDRGHLNEVERSEFLDSVKQSLVKWRNRLEDSHRSVDPVITSHDAIQIRHDAIALAFWEQFNQDTFRPPDQRLILVTASKRIERAVKDLPAGELGGSDDEFASDYLLHPFDFLDECHLHLTGELHPEPLADMSGRLSTALDMLVKADSHQATQEAQTEFGEMWGKFLRASVLERVQRINNLRSKHLKRVVFVFKQAGISSDSSKENPLVGELAERGSDMLSEAADIRIRSLIPTKFSRGAPLLRLDKHPLAQDLQIRPPESYCRLVTAEDQRPRLLEEAGHRYTLHLLQARAMIWAGDWRTALRLCNFSLAISDKLPPRGDELVSDTDGREATYLAAICERFANGLKSDSLAQALVRAQVHLDKFVRLAEKACEASSIPQLDMELHYLRASSEKHAIGTTALLSRIFAPVDQQNQPIDQDSNLKEDIEKLLLCLRKTQEVARVVSSKVRDNSTPEEVNFLVYMCFRISQQLWANELQLRISTPINFGFGDTIELERLWNDVTQLEADKSRAHNKPHIPDSWLIEMCKTVLNCLLNKVAEPDYLEAINKLSNAAQTENLFFYDNARFAHWRGLIEHSHSLAASTSTST